MCRNKRIVKNVWGWDSFFIFKNTKPQLPQLLTICDVLYFSKRRGLLSVHLYIKCFSLYGRQMNVCSIIFSTCRWWTENFLGGDRRGRSKMLQDCDKLVSFTFIKHVLLYTCATISIYYVRDFSFPHRKVLLSFSLYVYIYWVFIAEWGWGWPFWLHIMIFTTW